MAISIESRISRHKEILSSEVDNEAVLLSLNTNMYFGLDEVASRIWALADKPILISEIIQSLLKEYEIDKETCQKEVLDFVELLYYQKLIVIIDEGIKE
jgi:hypothetical protein